MLESLVEVLELVGEAVIELVDELSLLGMVVETSVAACRPLTSPPSTIVVFVAASVSPELVVPATEVVSTTRSFGGFVVIGSVEPMCLVEGLGACVDVVT